MSLNLPAMLNLPPKLLPMITEFNTYRYLLLEGGRGSAKTQSAARFLLFLGGERKLRIVCGREIQNTIEESVHAVLKDLIEEYKLPYVVQARKITHKITGTTFTFKGFRDQGSVNIKGLEGVDIVWIDEAQSITKKTLDTLVPTIRKAQARIFFTMNRYLDDDEVPAFCYGRPDSMCIEINYNENPHCPQSIKIEAQTLKERSERDYNHIYLNVPLATASDYLFNYKKMQEAFKITPFGHTMFARRVMGIDFAAQGDDQCVATILDRVSNQHWQVFNQVAWDESDSMVSIGRIVTYIGEFKPDVSILDVGGMGHVVYNRLTELGYDIKRFDGAAANDGLVDKKHYINARANAYYNLKDWFDRGALVLPDTMNDTVTELKKIKMKFHSNGRRAIEPKKDMKKELGFSPDRADSLMMAAWGATHYLDSTFSSDTPKASGNNITRVNKSNRTARSTNRSPRARHR